MHVHLEEETLGHNRDLAQQNRERFVRAGVVVVNVMSSPGAGKTTLVQRTLERLAGRLRTAALVGDVATTRDAERLAATGRPVVQVNTRGACHLDARMVQRAITHLDLETLDLLVIENVGNLVCPADFLLGEDLRVTVLSVVEGDDKVAKYPVMFRTSDAVVLNKMDLLPFTNFDLDAMRRDLRILNPEARIFYTVATASEGLEEWVDWLEARVRALAASRA